MSKGERLPAFVIAQQPEPVSPRLSAQPGILSALDWNACPRHAGIPVRATPVRANGKADRSKLDECFISRLHPDLIFIPPEGNVLRAAQLKAGFEQTCGANPGFRIQIRDVEIHHDLGDHILATYSEWQKGAKASEHANNARLTSVIMAKGDPMTWVHLQETWLPEEVRAAASFDF